MKILYEIIVLILIISVKSDAQPAIWTRYYDPSGTRDFGIDAIQTFDGGYMILSNSKSGMYFIKTNYLGDVQFQKVIYPFGGSYRFIQTSDSGFAICGLSIQNRMILIKTDMNGDTIWIKQFSLDGRQSRAWSVKSTRDRGYILSGSVYPYQPDEVFIVKTDSSGNSQWAKNYSGNTSYDIMESNDGKFYSVEFSIVRKLDSAGNQIWTRPIGGGFKICESSDGNIYIGGGNDQFYLAKLDTAGNVIFQNYYFDHFANASGMCIDEDENILLSGSILTDTGVSKGNLDALYAKFSPTGQLIFSKLKAIKGTFNERLSSCNNTDDFGYILCGYTQFPDGGIFGENVLVVKTDSTGNSSAIVNIPSGTSTIDKEFMSLDNYPNPFNSTTTISYSISQKMHVRLYITDISGRVLQIIKSETQEAGYFSYIYNAGFLSSGAYFINLVAQNIQTIKKILLVK